MGRLNDVDQVWLLNQYRAAELRGANAILRLLRLADSSSLQRDLTRHLRDEASHALTWTRAIERCGGEVVDVDDPYQGRLAEGFGIPRTLVELLAVTLVSERRGLAQYQEHAADAATPEFVLRSLRAVAKDETWHVSYITEELERRGRVDESVGPVLARAEAADLAAVRALESAAASVGDST
jgi:hypothetical protein